MYKFRFILAWLMVGLMMIVIFSFSSQVAEDSNKISSGITEKIVETINKLVDTEIELKVFNHYVRKFAHFFIYFCLGFLLMNAMVKGNLDLKYCNMAAFLISVLYAITDEVHQAFVPGRGPGIKDVMIDSIGALTGISIFTIVFIILRKKL